MSRYSGKCDLADHIFMEKTYPKEGNPNIFVSDEMECFNIFKQKTGGKIYQYFKLELNDHNIDNEIKVVDNPNTLSKREIPWGDNKNHRTKKYVYTYWGKEYKSLKDINKIPYYTLKEIKFDTLLDIIPYYPHIITLMSSSEDKEYVVITRESFVDLTEEDHRKYGWSSDTADYFRKELQNHYIEVVKKYYNQLIDDPLYKKINDRINDILKQTWEAEERAECCEYLYKELAYLQKLLTL